MEERLLYEEEVIQDDFVFVKEAKHHKYAQLREWKEPVGPENWKELEEAAKKATAALAFEDEEHLARHAAVLVERGRLGLYSVPKEDLDSLRKYERVHSKSMVWVIRSIIAFHHLLAIIETPSVFPNVLQSVPMFLELMCLVVYFIVIRAKAVCMDQRKRHMWTIVAYMCGALLFVDIMSGLLQMAVHPHLPPLRVFRFLRVFFMVYFNKHLRRSVRDMVLVMPRILDVFVVFCLIVFGVAVVLTVVYSGQEEGRKYFSSPWQGWISLFVATTTANFPDVMMPAYAHDRASAFVFMVYMIVTIYFLMNLVLAVTYNEYRFLLKKDVERHLSLRSKLIKEAFDLLAAPQRGQMVVTKERWIELFHYLKPGFSLDKVGFFFRILHTHHHDEHAMVYEEFYHLPQLLSVRVHRKELVREWLDKLWPLFCTRPWVLVFRKFVSGPKFDLMMDGVIILNTLVIFEVVELDGNRHGLNVQDIFTGIFVCEIVLKMTVLGIKTYFVGRWNRFDFFIITITLTDRIMAHVMDGSSILGFGTLFRLLRLCRLLSKIKRLRFIVVAFRQLLRSVVTFAGVQFCLFYVFIMIGNFIWAPHALDRGGAVEGTDFAKAGYWENNWDDFLRSFITLFELSIVNNWHVIVSGYVAVSNAGVWVFFILFYFLGVVVVTNVVTSFILEAGLMQLAIQENSQQFPLVNRILSIAIEYNREGRGTLEWIPKKNFSRTEILHMIFDDEIFREHNTPP